MKLKITAHSLTGSIQLPASKSISNRVLIIRSLCHDFFEISNLSEANDTLLLEKLLEQIRMSRGKEILDCEDAGTPFRFLTAYSSLQEGREFILTGSERLKERPILDLVAALQSMGANIKYTERANYPPIRIIGTALNSRPIKIAGNVSSQFVSALCLIAPFLKPTTELESGGLVLEILNHVVSDAYIIMTLKTMKEFGIQYEFNGNIIQIPYQQYKAQNIEIENDWSSATFFYTMSMMANEVDITMNGLFEKSWQGDAIIKEIATDFGIETTFNKHECRIRKIGVGTQESKQYDLSSYPDLAIPFIVACAMNYPQVSITGIHHLELKESKRISALQTELKKIDVHLFYENEILTFKNESNHLISKEVSFHTYHDHRIAMALSMLTLKGYLLTLDHTDCVRKSFPGFFIQLKQLRFEFLT
jgi:3-phosphoshikimate 1-carboxyvinyltransferase